MGRDRTRVLVLALGYLAAIIPSLFVMDWFVLDLGIDSLHIRLTNGRGMYGSLATSVFWGSLLVMVPAVAFQTFTRVTSGIANPKLSRYGIYAGLTFLMTGLAAAYVFAPEVPAVLELGPQVERTIAPLVFVIGSLLGIGALHYAALETTDDDAGTYKKVVIDKPVDKPADKPITEATPPIARPATIPPVSAPRPATVPPTTKHKLSFLVLSGEVTRAGIDARREDGSSLLVLWRDVVGVVVRRLPDELDATTFMDIVSLERSTLRIVPWTRLTGISVVGTGDDRVRSLAGYIATMCNDVQLFDPATKLFLEKPEPAAQLKDTAKLAAHDERLR